ncbi:DNA polymerase III subunit chi [Allosphingosinicella vermicomposti]|uniref:DNA polymerase III subunit chi n=1 Tax=Allosphingosinicella vermicomposti TaxID=614671 RepID=UPI000D1129E9|nr:DNA polymerase III subunit chi [Allosphingosinicella vermicomposti]
MRIGFYHLTAVPLERTLPRIAERVLADGQRLLVVADETLLDRLDELLWTYAPASFLPHGRERADIQPVFLSKACEAANGATHILIADGIWRDEALSFDRTFYLFDESRIADARTAWRQLKGREGANLSYWKQDEQGKWVEGP